MFTHCTCTFCTYFCPMRQHLFHPCIPTRATAVPTGPGWLHELKHDGFRLIPQREGERVRLALHDSRKAADESGPRGHVCPSVD
jgi:ATP-dependent DNA ligase